MANCKYIDCGVFTAVLTPHWQDSWAARKHLAINATITGKQIATIWNAAITDKVCGVKHGQAFIYFRRKFNGARNRWELEFITITPAKVFHTKRLTHAIRVEISW